MTTSPASLGCTRMILDSNGLITVSGIEKWNRGSQNETGPEYSSVSVMPGCCWRDCLSVAAPRLGQYHLINLFFAQPADAPANSQDPRWHSRRLSANLDTHLPCF